MIGSKISFQDGVNKYSGTLTKIIKSEVDEIYDVAVVELHPMPKGYSFLASQFDKTMKPPQYYLKFCLLNQITII